MPDASIRMANLTELEQAAESSRVNLADGHARQDLTVQQRDIVDRLPDLFAEAARTPVPELDLQLHTTFLNALGQSSALTTAHVLSCYSSSVATEIAGRALYRAGVRLVGVVHPTFDNIPDILAGVGLRLVPLSETALKNPETLPSGLDAVVVTSPNNPTGSVVDAAALGRLSQRCADQGTVLVLDSCFRGFDQRTWFDHYAILERTGVEWVIVEDTGKVFPTLDLKVGLLVFARKSRLPLLRIYSDLLLGVSPLITLMLTEFSRDGANGGFARLHQMITEQRTLLRSAVADLNYEAWCDPGNRISVQRLRLADGVDAEIAADSLRRDGVHVLPCGPFHWARPVDGRGHLRVALGRRPEVLRAGVDVIAEHLSTWSRGLVPSASTP